MVCDFTNKEDPVLLSISTNTNSRKNVNAVYLAQYFLSKASRTKCN